MYSGIRDKVVIVTGGGSGIGRATSLLFAKEGAKVCVADIDERGKSVVDAINTNNGVGIFVKTDVSKASDVKAMVDTVVERLGGVDILVNNAGIRGKVLAVTELAEEDWDAIVDVNLKGVYLGCKYAIPEMLKAGRGVIVITASAAGLRASPRSPAYCAVKAGLINFTKVIALDYGSKNIRCNCVCPGVVDTDFYDSSARKEIVPKAAATSLVGRAGRPEDIAHAILYLSSDESQFATGSALVIDGGITAYGVT